MIFEESIDEAVETHMDVSRIDMAEGTEDAVAEDAVAEDAVAEDAVAEDAVAEDAVAEDVVAEDVVAEDVVAEDVVAEDAMAEDTADETVGELLEQVESSSGWKLEQIDHEKSEKDIQEERVVEAVLFTMGRSVEVRQLAAALDSDEESARAAAIRLQSAYEKNHCAMQIIELEDSFQMCTREMYYENLIKVAKTPKKQVLTDVILEVLSIIAYKQPVTKAQINKIRGVNSDHSVSKLVEYGLIYEAGRLDAPGRPTLFATTEEFLRRFGVGSKKDLPQTTPDQVALIEHEVAEEVNYRFGTEPGTDEASEELDMTRENMSESYKESSASDVNGSDATIDLELLEDSDDITSAIMDDTSDDGEIEWK